jgi:SAM-dependent methyltransferase
MEPRTNGEMKLYSELAEWWQVISPTADYVDEAAFFGHLFEEAGASTILELGAGGGNIASFLKHDFEMTLTDLSPRMIESSKKQNPECEHFVGDMRSVSLDRTFDGVFIHDAIMYMISEGDLRAVFNNAHRHCKPGGILVVAPDCTRETFKECTDYEGHDAPPPDNRSVRYIQWTYDADPADTVFNYDFILALRKGEELTTAIDRQLCGVFPRKTWLELMSDEGFDAKAVKDTSTNTEPNDRAEIFVGHKR